MPWICRMMALLISGLFFLTGLPLGNWLCCCAINPMHFTALGNGTRLFLLPRSVSNGTQTMWRYGSSGCFPPLTLLVFLPSCQSGCSRNASLWMHLLFRQRSIGWGKPYIQRSRYRDGGCWDSAWESGIWLPGRWCSVRGWRSSLDLMCELLFGCPKVCWSHPDSFALYSVGECSAFLAFVSFGLNKGFVIYVCSTFLMA